MGKSVIYGFVYIFYYLGLFKYGSKLMGVFVYGDNMVYFVFYNISKLVNIVFFGIVIGNKNNVIFS